MWHDVIQACLIQQALPHFQKQASLFSCFTVYWVTVYLAQGPLLVFSWVTVYLAQGPLLVSTKLRNLFLCLLGQGVLMCSLIPAVPIPYLIYLCSPGVLYWYLQGQCWLGQCGIPEFLPITS